MKLVNLNLIEFSNEIDSLSPAPGGGSVSALAGGVGASLTRMVGHLTIGKKKFKALDEDTQNKFNSILKEFLHIKEELQTQLGRFIDLFKTYYLK